MSHSVKGPAQSVPSIHGKAETSGPRSIAASSTAGTGKGLQKHQIKEVDLKQKSKAVLTRLVYDWEWEIPNFDGAFPPYPPSPIPVKVRSFSPTIRTLRSEKVEVGEEIGKKTYWQFQISTLEGWLRWHLCLIKISRHSLIPIYFHYELKLVDKTGKELLSKKGASEAHGLNEYGWNNLIELEKFWEQRESFLHDNKLRMQITLELLRDHTKSVDVELKQKLSEFSLLMTEDMVRLRKTESTADVTIECKGKMFPAHRLILSARSSAFAHMFENQMCKSHSHPNTLVLNDVESYIVEALLEYMYTGAVNVKYLQNNEMMSGLIQAADKYQLHQLKSFCFSAMTKVITAETVGELCVLAYRHHADKCVKQQLEGFCSGNLDKLIKVSSFKNALKQEPDAFFSDDPGD